MKPLLARWMIVSLLAVAPAAARTADTATDTAANPDSTATASTLAGRNPAIVTRSGLDIHRRFRAHLAEPECSNASAKWRAHYAAMPKRLTEEDDELLALFGYVVDEFIKAGLPTEYALVPVIESRYNPAARSSAGPAGMWQFIGLTARNQGITMRADYDGRYSVIESTRAAVRYFKILHSMFGQNWRVAIMGYNAGEYRVIGAIKRSGMSQRQADAGKIQGVPALTRAYVEKLHAISCLIEQADDRKQWTDALDRPVPMLAAETVEEGSASLDDWARARQLDPALLKRLNPALARGSMRSGQNAPKLLAPMRGATATSMAGLATGDATPASSPSAEAPSPGPTVSGTHVVAKGESWWVIARRHGLSVDELLRRNGLSKAGALRPGMVLKLDAPAQ
ncbi:MAG: transglycosylase SLT domain-containing protein [Xanthomonadaceae bacterium]|nr:transglycosylase SLT domain-containing protein [Xanthomonadaceae bacterium]